MEIESQHVMQDLISYENIKTTQIVPVTPPSISSSTPFPAEGSSFSTELADQICGLFEEIAVNMRNGTLKHLIPVPMGPKGAVLRDVQQDPNGTSEDR